MSTKTSISDRQIEALNAIAEGLQAIAAAVRETPQPEQAQIDAPVPAVGPDSGSGGSRTSGGLGERLRALIPDTYTDDGYFGVTALEIGEFADEAHRLESERDIARADRHVATEGWNKAHAQIERVRALATQSGPNLSCAGHNVGDDGCFVAGLAQRVLAVLDGTTPQTNDTEGA